MRVIYDLGIRFYYALALLLSLWDRKARLWVKGRKGWREDLRNRFSSNDQVVWFHCASLGEFEQGRPLIEGYRKRCPEDKILLTFFSPSGYEKRKDFEGADHVMYLPLDTRRNVRDFLKLVPLKKALFVKYEFWLHYLRQLSRKEIPIYLASGIFRPGQLFFRSHGRWYLRFLEHFTHIHVQQEESAALLRAHGIQQVSVAGDTRFDRVSALPGSPFSHPVLDRWCKDKRVVVAGSTWEPDEALLSAVGASLPGDLGWIIAPHEITEGHLKALLHRFPDAVLYTELTEEKAAHARVILVNSIGQLSYLYRYATLAYVGGGFGKGIHNTLEAATYGVPVIFGPRYQKFREAGELISLGGAFSVATEAEMLFTFRQQLDMNTLLKTSSEIAQKYVREGVGATALILDKLCISTG